MACDVMVHVKGSQLVRKYISAKRHFVAAAAVPVAVKSCTKEVGRYVCCPSRESRILSLSLRPLSHSLPFRENPADMTSTKYLDPFPYIVGALRNDMFHLIFVDFLP